MELMYVQRLFHPHLYPPLEGLPSPIKGEGVMGLSDSLEKNVYKHLLQKRCHLLVHRKQTPRSIGYSACLLCSTAESSRVTVFSEIPDPSHF